MRRVALHSLLVLFAVPAVAAVPAAAAAYGDANVSLYHTDADLDGADDVETAVANGTAVAAGTDDPDERVVLGDALVVVVDSGRLAADVDARDGTPTERFFAVLDGDPQLLVHQYNYKQLWGPKVLRLGPQNTTVYRAGNTTYAVVDTGSVDVDRPRSEDRDSDRIENGDEYFVEIADTARTAPSEGPLFEVLRNESRLDDGPYAPLAPEPNRVTVRTYVEADDEHLVRVVLDDGRVLTAPVDASVEEYSTESAVQIDLSDVEPGTGYTLEVVHDGSVVDSRTGAVREPTATLSDVRVTEVDGERRLNLTATLSHGGQVVTTTADGERRRAREVRPGTETELSIPVVSASGEVLVPEDGRVRALRPDGTAYPDAEHELGDRGAPLRTPTASETETPTPTPTPVAERERPSTPGATGTPSGTESQPGFGAALAVVALAALAALAGRRARD